MSIWIAAAGDACDMSTWSGIPAHLVRWATFSGHDVKGLSLARPSETTRKLWNLGRVLTTGSIGGFQYSDLFLNRMWDSGRDLVRGQTVVNCYQVYPDSVLRDSAIRKWFYCDGTLTQLWEDSLGYLGHKLPPAVVKRALALEKRGFEAADGLIFHSEWAAESARRDYGIDPRKVYSVIPGANFEPELFTAFHSTQAQEYPQITGPLRLVFNGRYWKRKGLDRLLRAMRIAQSRGTSFALRVIGCKRDDVPEELQDVPDVDWLGSIDKGREGQQFLETVSWGEVGCLLSLVEFGGMVLREYASLGMAALAPDVWGSPEHAGPGAVLVKPEADDEEIAAILQTLAERGPQYHQLRSAAWSARDQALWSASVDHIERIIQARS